MLNVFVCFYFMLSNNKTQIHKPYHAFISKTHKLNYELLKKIKIFCLLAFVQKNLFVIVVFVVHVYIKKTRNIRNTNAVITVDTKRPDEKCGPNEWECDNHECINIEFLCDGTKDCLDFSDEGRGCVAGNIYSYPMHFNKNKKRIKSKDNFLIAQK